MKCKNCRYWDKLVFEYDDPENLNFGYCDKHDSKSVRVLNSNFEAVETKGYSFLPHKDFGCSKFKKK